MTDFRVRNGKLATAAILGQPNPDSSTLEHLQQLDEFRALPALAALLAHNYNVTARSWPVSIFLFRMAMSAEALHNVEERADRYLDSRHQHRILVSVTILNKLRFKLLFNILIIE